MSERRDNDKGHCEGPLVWHDTEDSHAILECATCDYIIVTTNPNDERHQNTPILRGGLATR